MAHGWRPRLPRARLWRCLLFAASFVAVCALAFVGEPGRSPWLPSCLFHRLTGVWCPGCGNTRALHALTHGELLASLRNNILLIPALLTLGALALRPRLALSPRLCAVVATVVILFFVLRNLPWWPFCLLAPL